MPFITIPNPRSRTLFPGALLIAVLTMGSCGAAAQTAFTYQGRLNASGQSASGIYDFRFILYSADVGGNQVGSILTVPSVNVVDGLFATALDFGAQAFDGSPRWLEMAVRTNGAVDFTPLTPRQPISPTPYAMYAANAGQAQTAASLSGNLPASQITGTLLNSTLADGSVTWPKLAPGTVSRLTTPSGSATNLVVSSSGFVGINITNPVYRLDVNGGIRSTYLNVQGEIDAAGSITADGSLYANGGAYVEGDGRFRGTVYAGSSAFGSTNHLEVTGSARVRTNLFVNGDLFVGDDLVIGNNKGNVRSDGSTQLKIGFTSGNFALNLGSGVGADIQFVLPSFPAGTAANQVRVHLAQFIPDAGSGTGFQQFTMIVYAIDIASRLCTVRFYNAGGAFASIDGTLYLMTIGPAE